MQKVIIIGSSGAGKSTFARKLRDKSGLPLYYLDLLWHRPDRTTVSNEVFDAQLKELLSRDKWIIDGNYQRTLSVRLNACDTVFLLDFPLDVCLSGVESRIGQARADMPWIETEFDPDFKQWIIEFQNTHLLQIYMLLEQYRETKTVVIFKSRQEADDYLSALY